MCELVPHTGEGERRARRPGRSVQVVSMARCPGSSCPLLYKYVHKATCASSPGSSQDPCWETGEGRLVLDTAELKPQVSGGVKRRVPLTPGDFVRMLPVVVLRESPGFRAPPQGMSPPTGPRRASRCDLQPVSGLVVTHGSPTARSSRSLLAASTPGDQFTQRWRNQPPHSQAGWGDRPPSHGWAESRTP